jgi:putative acetyltransferase
MVLIEDPLTDPRVHALLREHLENMLALTPAESVHALDLQKLKVPEITCWSAWDGPELLGFGALKSLGDQAGEIKSMRTSRAHLRKGVARAVLQHVLETAAHRSYRRLYLETGASEAFVPARNLYRAFGFEYCGPFGEYVEDPHSSFMKLDLASDR